MFVSPDCRQSRGRSRSRNRRQQQQQPLQPVSIDHDKKVSRVESLRQFLLHGKQSDNRQQLCLQHHHSNNNGLAPDYQHVVYEQPHHFYHQAMHHPAVPVCSCRAGHATYQVLPPPRRAKSTERINLISGAPAGVAGTPTYFLALAPEAAYR